MEDAARALQAVGTAGRGPRRECAWRVQDKQGVGLGQKVQRRGTRSEETGEAHLVLRGTWILLRVTMVWLPCLESVWLLSNYGV